MRRMRFVKVLWLLPLAIGCEAHFTDLRPDDRNNPDLDAGFLDLGPPPSDDTPILEGTFSGRGSYRGSGGVSIVRKTDDTFELVFADDFSVSSVPGPVIVLSTRETLGRSIQESQGDLD